MSDLSNSRVQRNYQMAFGEGFFADHAGRIINDPEVAMAELVANAWDAGADTVEIVWYCGGDNLVEIRDNGTGMSEEEFVQRWRTLNYNRQRFQGSMVQFPLGNNHTPRVAFGRNGKGRHGMFTFGEEYEIETIKDGTLTHYLVRLTDDIDRPYEIQPIDTVAVEAERHGTRLWTLATRNAPFLDDELRRIVGSKFAHDPAFRIIVNGKVVTLEDFSGMLEIHSVEIKDIGAAEVILLDTQTTSRTMQQHGVTWWTNNRRVTQVEWRKLDGDPYLDGRMVEAKRYTFVVKADMLLPEVKPDWNGFKPNSAKVKAVAEPVERYVEEKLAELLKKHTVEKRKEVLEENRSSIAPLPPLSRMQVSGFVDKLLTAAPGIRQDHLSQAVKVLANLEQSRYGFDLLRELSKLGPDDLDRLAEILQKWTVMEAAIVLDEIHRRLQIIRRLEELVHDKGADELHQLHPLFNQGLWIFGPEYESVEYTSNQYLTTVLRELFKDKKKYPELPHTRPDIVARRHSTLSLFARDHLDQNGSVDYEDSVLILELKRGGFQLGFDEMTQALRYCGGLRTSGKLPEATRITAFVMGASLAEEIRNSAQTETGPNGTKNTFVYVRSYRHILATANLRIMNLKRKLEELQRQRGGSPTADSEEDFLEQGNLDVNGKW